MRTIAWMSAAVALTAWLAAPAGAATIRVNCARANLQNKIAAAPAGSTVLVRGTCVGRFTVDKSLTLRGNPHATLDANELGRPLTIAGTPTVQLVDLTVTGGLVQGQQAQGGGIFHPGGALTLRRVSVVGNVVTATGTTLDSLITRAGGIVSTGGSLALLRSSVRRNEARAAAGFATVSAGGIYRLGNLKVVGSTITANKASADSSASGASSFGGGILVDEGDLSLRSSRVAGNRARASADGGASTAEGGGIYFTDGSVAIRTSTISGNRATARTQGTSALGQGGGIWALVIRGRIRNAVVSGNSVVADSTGDATAGGGGVWGSSSAQLSVRSSRVASNGVEASGDSGTASASGGGLETDHGETTIRSTTLDRNTLTASGATSDAGGGGLDVSGNLVMQVSTVSRNLAQASLSLGGGVYLPIMSTNSITNSTVAGNRALGTSARGGGIDTFATTLRVTNSTVARNTARLGGGVYVEQGTTTLAATIVAANRAPASADCGGPLASAGRNLIRTTLGCMFTPAPSDKVNRGAKLGILGAHGGPTQSIPLRPGSPALDAIPRAACAVARDQRGVKRPQGRRCDIGAFEQRR